MLHPYEYRTFCMSYIYKIINHDDTIPEKQLETYVDDTDKAWKKRNDKRKEAEEELRNWKPPQPAKPEPIPEVVKPTGIKSKIKMILKIKKKAKTVPTFLAPYTTLQSFIPPKPKNGYRGNKEMFHHNFNEGAYETEEEDSPATAEGDKDGEEEKDLPTVNSAAEGVEENLPIKADNGVISDEEVVNEKAVDELKATFELPSLEKNISEEDKDKASKVNGTDTVKLDKNEIIYDRENVSFHDKSKLNIRCPLF